MPVVDRKKEREIVERAIGRGFNKEQIKEVVLKFREQGAPAQTKGRTERIVEGAGRFTGTTGLGKGIGQAIFGLTPTARKLRQAEQRERETFANVPKEIIRRLAQEGKPIRGPQLAGQLEDITTGGITNKQVIGSAVATGAAVLGAGRLAGTRTLGLAGRTLTGAATGATIAGGATLSEGGTNEEAIRSAVIGSLVGGAAPALVSSAGVVARVGVNKVARPLGNAAAEILGATSGIGKEGIVRQFQRPQQIGAAIKKFIASKRQGQVFAESADALAKDVDDFNTATNKIYGKAKVNLFKEAGNPVIDMTNAVEQVDNILATDLGRVVKLSEKRALNKAKEEIASFIKSGDTGTSLAPKVAEFNATSVDELNQIVSKILNDSMSKPGQRATVYDRAATRIIKAMRNNLSDQVQGLEGLNRSYSETLNNTINVLLPKLKPAQRQKFIQSLFKTQPEIYHNAIGEVGEGLEKGITEALEDTSVGAKSTKLIPEDIARRIAAGFGFAANPSFAAAFSPRIVGTAVRTAGRVAQGVERTLQGAGRAADVVERGARTIGASTFGR